MRKLVYSFALLFLTLSGCYQHASDQDALNQETRSDCSLSESAIKRIDELFHEFNLESPGYAIGISKNGQTCYKKGYGSANLDYNIPIDSNSVFSIASVSKQFTAACIALLILDEEITLDDPAFKYIPQLKKYEDTIRIAHLVYNTSGIKDYYQLPRKNGRSWITFNYFDVDECIATSLSQDTLLFAPGEKWDYCNVNFMLLAKVVEQVSGTSFADFSRKRLFEPLGMMNTHINDDITLVVKHRVIPYNVRNKENVRMYAEDGVHIKKEGEYIQHYRTSPHYGGSGVMTTINDLLKWSRNMITKQFGGDEFYALIHKTQKFKHDRDNQAFGLYIGGYGGKKIIAWDGGDWGISSQLMRFPEQGVAIVVLSNLGSGEAYRKVNAIADILMEEKVIE